MCLYSRLQKNRKYTPNKKNGGIIPPISDNRVEYVPIKCGKCIECQNQIAREWQIRLYEEVKHQKEPGYFVTLTFSTKSLIEIKNSKPTKNWAGLKNIEGYALDNGIATRAVRLWSENWRKKTGYAPRHWLITELGHENTEHVHLHGIIWTTEGIEFIRKSWIYGYIYPKPHQEKDNYVSTKTVNYIIKYVKKIDKDHPNYKPKIFTSKGIGIGYIDTYNYNKNKFKDKDTIETYTTSTGHKIALPIYYRNKLYSEEEKEKLWLNKLDKNKRWIMGEEIPADIDGDKLLKTLDYYRRKNKELGYGDDEKNYDQLQYENDRRRLLYKERFDKELKNNASPAGQLNMCTGFAGAAKRTKATQNRPKKTKNDITKQIFGKDLNDMIEI